MQHDSHDDWLSCALHQLSASLDTDFLLEPDSLHDPKLPGSWPLARLPQDSPSYILNQTHFVPRTITPRSMPYWLYSTHQIQQSFTSVWHTCDMTSFGQWIGSGDTFTKQVCYWQLKGFVIRTRLSGVSLLSISFLCPSFFSLILSCLQFFFLSFLFLPFRGTPPLLQLPSVCLSRI